MGDIISLKQRRKQTAREQREATAAENRIKFGLSKAKKQAIKAEDTRADKSLDGHKRDI